MTCDDILNCKVYPRLPYRIKLRLESKNYSYHLEKNTNSLHVVNYGIYDSRVRSLLDGSEYNKKNFLESIS